MKLLFDMQIAHNLLIDSSKSVICTDILAIYLAVDNMEAYKFTTKYAVYKYSIMLTLLHSTPL